MANSNSETSPPRPARLQPRRRGWTLRLTPGGVFLLLLVNLLVLGILSFGLSRLIDWKNDVPLVATTQLSLTTTPSQTTSPTQTELINQSLSATPLETTTTPPASPTSIPPSNQDLSHGLIMLALDEGANIHLFAYQPQATGGNGLPLTRLTTGPWDDITPAISPDGKHVAFASNRNGYWDLYLLDLAGGQVSRLTDTPEYDAAPSWSPDGLWLTYETYRDKNLEILILSMSELGEPIRLTNYPASDHSPAWSPAGRIIAFVSDRSGENEIWLADLDKNEEDRFQNLSNNPLSLDTHPSWSPDGTILAWAGEDDGFHNLYLGGETQSERRVIGSGDWPAWSPVGDLLLTLLLAPNQSYLTAYPLGSAGVLIPPLQLPGTIQGLSWGTAPPSLSLHEQYKQAFMLTTTPLYQPKLTAKPDDEGGRYQLVALDDIEAPFPLLHDEVDEAFQALRNRVAYQSGWDLLAALENAYVPLTTFLDPGMGDDWLFTGRAFAFTTSPINAGWLVIVRQDFGAETYWRVYMRSRYQDGSSGIPLHDRPWDMAARYAGDAAVFQQGGKILDEIPAGYWIDFTQRALAFSFQRLPALSTWRASYPAARFNEFTFSAGLDWRTAMLELYPAEALLTPSPVVPDTRTPTATLRWYQSPTPTTTPTFRPTFTQISQTPTIAYTPSPTLTSTSPSTRLTSTPQPTATEE